MLAVVGQAGRVALQGAPVVWKAARQAWAKASPDTRRKIKDAVSRVAPGRFDISAATAPVILQEAARSDGKLADAAINILNTAIDQAGVPELIRAMQVAATRVVDLSASHVSGTQLGDSRGEVIVKATLARKASQIVGGYANLETLAVALATLSPADINMAKKLYGPSRT